MGARDHLPRVFHTTAPELSVPEGNEHAVSTPRPDILSEEVEDVLWKGIVTLVPLDQERSGFYSTYFLIPKQAGVHMPILNLKFFRV